MERRWRWQEEEQALFLFHRTFYEKLLCQDRENLRVSQAITNVLDTLGCLS